MDRFDSALKFEAALDAQGELISAATSLKPQRRAFVQMASATAPVTVRRDARVFARHIGVPLS